MSGGFYVTCFLPKLFSGELVMRIQHLVLLLIFVLLLNPNFCLGADENPEISKLPPLEENWLSNLEEEINSLLELEKQQVAALEKQRSATNPVKRLELDRQLCALKKDTEIAILEAQHKFAVISGQTDLARKLEAVLAVRRDPQARLKHRGVLNPQPSAELGAGGGK